MKPGEVQTYLPPPPHQIVEYLNGHIIGHYVMKKAISVAIYNHFCNINFSRYFLSFKVLTASSCLLSDLKYYITINSITKIYTCSYFGIDDTGNRIRRTLGKVFAVTH